MVPTVAWTSRVLVDSHHWLVENKKSDYSWNVGSKSKLGKDTWSYSRVMLASGRVRLVQTLKDHVANEPHTRWECRSAEYAQNTALFPLTDLFQRLCGLTAEETPDAKLAKLEQTLSQYRLPLEESVPLFAPCSRFSLPEDHAMLRSISHHSGNDRKRWKPSSPSSWNWPNVSRCSSSWKTCTGRTRQPSNC